MDTLLRGEAPSEVIPFSLDAPVLYYPVRHHSPACAWHLERVIQRYSPDCILVEGPENANDLIPVLTHPDTKAPVALYYAYRDDAGLLGPEHGEESFRCYYPFLDHSPPPRWGYPAGSSTCPMGRSCWPPKTPAACALRRKS